MNNTVAFYSKDGKEFYVHKAKAEHGNGMIEPYIEQVCTNGRLLDSEKISKDGIDFILDPQDMLKAYEYLKAITESCVGPLELIDENKFVVSTHVTSKKKRELKEKGFSINPTRLLEEIATILFYTEHIEKAKIHFDSNHFSKKGLSFTLNAPLGNKSGRIAISFKREFSKEAIEGRLIMVVTVLSLK
ncbi:hypothetical protein [Bacillus sp. CHD6a]|uniref:hypothetical protein n=1 Tax=Bacillus sp. CHD6a TaxID=1643452 RepID=UPI0006CC90AC|nr:hypothetical protein [Bacillus sp. CHD6a]KPB06037.1 hypothetical protein AAV98_03720 [Bacillus sp. CHD6a]